MTAEPQRQPSRAGTVRTFAGGVQLCGPILRIPGRTLFASAEDIAEAEQHAAAVLAAVAELRREYPHST